MAKSFKAKRRVARRYPTKKTLPKKKKASGSAKRELPGFQQGVGEVSAPRFGSCDVARVNYGFDANHPSHLPLPIQTGPYMVMRVTTKISWEDAKPVMVFGTFRGAKQANNINVSVSTQNPQSFADGWASACAVGGNLADPIRNASTWFPQPLGEVSRATMTPSALSVQIMNADKLQDSAGIVYAARLKTQFRGVEAGTDSWRNFGDQMVSFMQPRLMSAGKIALKGVKVDSVPFNTFELQDFDRVLDLGPSLGFPAYTPYVAGWKDSAETTAGPNIVHSCKGFAPIAVYNPDSVKLDYLVTTEYRVRFDISHPAASTHKLHHPTSQSEWSTAIARAMATGHGVLDIVESVSSLGERAFKLAAPFL